MGSLVQEVKRWATEELDLPPHSLPHDSYIKTLCVGAGASIWKYVIQHVYSERKVRLMRGNLQWYKILQDKELKQVEGQNKDARRVELQREISELQTELSHIDQKISTAKEQLANEEQNVNRQRAQYEESRLRELMLDSFRLRCAEERDALSHDTHTISSQWQALEQLSRKAEVKVVFGGSDDGDSGTAAEPLVLRNVRDLCRERILFFQSLQDNMLKSTSSEFTSDQRNAAYQHWLSAVEDVLRSHPPNQVLLALQALASKQQVALEEKTAALDVERDVSALGFRYESNHLLDVSVEEEEDLPPVRSLLQSAWEEVEHCYMRLAEVRSRARRLHADLDTLTKDVQLRILGQDDLVNPMARSVFELELQAVRQTAMRDSVREQCAQLQLENREKREALRSLHTQWQSIMDFRQLVDIRQEQIRSLIKGNSTMKTELTRVHSELRQFVREKLSPQFEGVIRSANELRNSVSHEAKLFNSVSLAALDRRIVDGERIPVNQLSLYRGNSPALQAVHQSLCTPLYMAPELLLSQTVSQRLQLRFLRRLLQLRTDSLTDMQNRTAQLPGPNQQALLQRVKAEDADLLQSLLPRLQELTQRCSKGVAYASQVNTAITHWWEQPAQFALPDMQQEGLTFQQWLQRWKLATKEL
ncbi:HAUS augmin-like complex subunit 5 [Pangasianodon hypophthalmus]|uniref:HAUS augmin-like complex subunit 5 n=1 Tax=Pangasianodon hypophthalmus TaxID=310915 RepID=UPI00230787E6|nr:HAUS augmin-like complex subunit 5 [Pangasianodon hypophthalmus]